MVVRFPVPVPDNGLVVWKSEFGHNGGGDIGCHTSPTQAAPPTGPAISNHNNVHIKYLYIVGYLGSVANPDPVL